MDRRLSPGVAAASAAALALAGCGAAGGWNAPGGRGAPATPGGNTSLAAVPEALTRGTVIARSAEVLAEAAAAGDLSALARFERYAGPGDPDPPATRAMAARAEGLLAGRHIQVPARWRHALARIAASPAAPPAPRAAEPIRFPRDEGAHWGAITEWWYLNGHLAGGAERMGYEVTLFRVGPVLHWAHVALTDERAGTFRHARDWFSPGRTRSEPGRLDVRYGGQVLRAVGMGMGAGTVMGAAPSAGEAGAGEASPGTGTGTDTGAYRLEVAIDPDTRLSLDLTSRKAPLLVNGDGTIDMPEGRDSRYYSQTRLETAGAVTAGGRTVAVTGLTWLDHQWGPFYVSGFRERWDWFSVQTDDGMDYNLFAFRAADGTPLARHVNRLDAGGTYRGGGRLDLDRANWWTSPRTGFRYPLRWDIALPDAGERIRLEATVAGQEVHRFFPFPLDPLPEYWEGSMRAVKTRADGRQVAGVAYTETFGYR